MMCSFEFKLECRVASNEKPSTPAGLCSKPRVWWASIRERALQFIQHELLTFAPHAKFQDPESLLPLQAQAQGPIYHVI